MRTDANVMAFHSDDILWSKELAMLSATPTNVQYHGFHVYFDKIMNDCGGIWAQNSSVPKTRQQTTELTVTCLTFCLGEALKILPLSC